MTLVLLEPLSSYSTITGGQTLSIGFSVGYSYNASKSLCIAGDVNLLVLYASFDFKHEDCVIYFKKTFVRPNIFCNDLGYFIHFLLSQDLISCSSNVKDIVQAHPSVNDGQRSSHKFGFRRHIGIVYFYYLVGSAKRPDSTFFFLASTELVFTIGFLAEKDHVLSVKRRESYNADGLLVSAPYADVHEDAKHSLKNDSKLPWTYHTIFHVYRQCDCCYKEAVLSETNCSTAWSPLSSLICTHNKWCIALYYMEKSGMKLPYSFTGVFLPSNLVKQMVVPRIGFRTAGSFYLSVRLNTDLIQANVEILAAPGSSSLLRICYMPLEVAVELQVPLPSMLYHIARNLHKTNVFVLNFSREIVLQECYIFLVILAQLEP
ncbi:hypothetical protein MTR67_021985 [Solanum verrucosum]|uniref:Uncharacterized protein n=1 Tax=Solanum verrucosum TaxID=315347 RepID=A0AAF0TWA1_SOLVR|nr:hypothetical protein MTR67_021985 [Solanum verrucosum]